MPKTADLLEEIAALKAMLIAADARDKRKDERIARLEKLVAAFKQAVFGRKSEKSDPDQFELALEDLETAMAVIHAEEDVSERLDIVPVQFRGIVTRRPKYACRSCADGVVQAPAPARLIAGSMPTEATVAHVLVIKYADHLPLYRVK